MRTRIVTAAALLLCSSLARADGGLGDMRRALDQAREDAKALKTSAAEKSLARAEAAMDAISEYVSLDYFPGLFSLRADEIEFTAPQGAAYQEAAAELEFLRAAPGAKIKLKPGKERAAQLERLKIYFAFALETAAAQLRGLDDRKLSKRLDHLAEWGVETSVTQNGGKDYVQVLTRERRDWVFASGR